MGSKTDILCAKLRETSSLLHSVGEHHWAKWLEESLRRIRNGDYSGIAHLRGAYGGMGSFNDLVLGSFNGHSVADDDYKHVNDRLDLLRSELYELSGHIQRRDTTTDLREKVRQCLLHDWDPIGVRNVPEASDEYDSYVGGVCSLLLSGADAYKLRKHLAHTETVNMGLSTPTTHLDDVVQKLLAMVED